jgi:hypothetical protein
MYIRHLINADIITYNRDMLIKQQEVTLRCRKNSVFRTTRPKYIERVPVNYGFKSEAVMETEYRSASLIGSATLSVHGLLLLFIIKPPCILKQHVLHIL